MTIQRIIGSYLCSISWRFILELSPPVVLCLGKDLIICYSSQSCLCCFYLCWRHRLFVRKKKASTRKVRRSVTPEAIDRAGSTEPKLTLARVVLELISARGRLAKLRACQIHID